MSIISFQNNSEKFVDLPGKCPFCHHTITPVLSHKRSFYDSDENKHVIELTLTCPNSNCNRSHLIFTRQVATPSNAGGTFFDFIEIARGRPSPLNFDQIIHEISPAFVEIYTEAHQAEENGLTNICGVGYRKALEFLIKDFLISQKIAEEQAIKEMFLGKCIKDLVDNDKLKSAAKRAAWLGNDETHYERRWIDKDLTDLKRLIKLTIFWIEMEKLSQEIEVDMPDKS